MFLTYFFFLWTSPNVCALNAIVYLSLEIRRRTLTEPLWQIEIAENYE